MVYKFNTQHYQNVFDSMFGKGKFNSGISMASKVGALKGRAAALRPYYMSALNKQIDENQQQRSAQANYQAEVKNAHENRMKQFFDNQDKFIQQSKKKIKSPPKKKKKQSFIGVIGNDISKAGKGLKNEASDVATLLNPFSSQKDKVKSTVRFSKTVTNQAKSAGKAYTGTISRYVVPVSKAMDDVLTGGMNSKLMKKNGTNKQGKITDQVVRAAEKNRGTETKVLHGIGTALGYVAPMDAGYGAAGKILSGGSKLIKAGSPLAKVAEKAAIKAPKLTKLAKISTKGAFGSAIGQAGVEGLQETFNPKANNLSGHLKNIGTAAAAGAVLDPALRVGGKLLGKGIKSASTKIPSMKNIGNTLIGSRSEGIVPASMAKKGTKIANTSDQIVGTKIKYDEGLKNKVVSAANKAKTNLVDDLNPIKQIFGDKTYGVAMDSRRGNNLANTILNDKFVTPEGKVVGKSLKEVVGSIPRGEYKQVRDYLVLKDAASRMDNGQKVYADNLNMTADKARQAVARIEKIHPEYKQISKDWNDFHSNLKKHYGVSEDLLSQQASDAMDQARPNYVPMNRQFSSSEKPKGVGFSGSKNGLSGQKAPVKKVNQYGSQRPIYDPVKSTIEKVGQYTNASMRNRAMNSMIDQIASNPEKYKDIAQIVKGNTSPAQTSSGNLLSSLENDFTGLKKGQKLNDPNIVRGMRNGEPVYVQVHNPQLVKALSGMGPERSNVVINIAHKFSNWTKQGATGALAPIFAVKGAGMDLAQSVIQSKHPVKQAAYTMYGILSGLADELKIPGLRNMAREYYLSGGKYDFALKGDKGINASLGSMVKDPLLSPKGLAKGTKNVVATPFRVLQGFGDAIENAPRMAAARIKLNELGGARTRENVQQAMSSGREATVNYSRKGAFGHDMESFVPYQNAAIQGVYRIMKAFKDHPAQTAASIATFAVLPKITEYVRFGNDPDYNKLPARVTMRNIIIGKNKDGTFAMIPVEPGYNSFGQMAIDAMKYYQKHDKYAFEGAADALANVWAPPITTGALQGITQGGGLEGSLVGAMNATTFAPFSAIASNKAFYGGPIVPARLQNNSPGQQFDERTSSIAKYLGQKMGLSPMKADYLIKSYGGDVARLVMPLTSSVGAGNPKTVMLRNFIADPTMTNNLANDYFNMKQNITQAQADARTHGVKLPSWASGTTADAMTSMSKYGISKQISDLTKQKQVISANKVMSAKLKEQRIRSLQSQINNIYLDSIIKMQQSGVPGRLKY